jgi:hypothetical protein
MKLMHFVVIWFIFDIWNAKVVRLLLIADIQIWIILFIIQW